MEKKALPPARRLLEPDPYPQASNIESLASSSP
jgi:hypothetical protein